MRPGCKVWALKGQRPLAFHRTRYEWLYVYLLVHPASGRSTFLILPTASGPTGVSAGGGPRGAEGSAAALTALHPKALPGSAREAVADERFPSLEALQERLAERCVYLQERPEVIRGVAGFGWIPEE
ncbi:MAG: hypothetical protein RQ868_05090 [Meiothermus sp.]|uniref:hypothetical protein n=1 Tax=Meiothermus sp. TaxID=1955249 RepID=UPI0028CD0344|nr:hypothetical protein [Meiothermus sp.]MDT7919948.1 hypothetical protein [Meiothermus sp.]